MPAHEPEILQGRVNLILPHLQGLSVSEQLAILGVMAGIIAATLPANLHTQAFEVIGRSVQVGAKL